MTTSTPPMLTPAELGRRFYDAFMQELAAQGCRMLGFEVGYPWTDQRERTREAFAAGAVAVQLALADQRDTAFGRRGFVVLQCMHYAADRDGDVRCTKTSPLLDAGVDGWYCPAHHH